MSMMVRLKRLGESCSWLTREQILAAFHYRRAQFNQQR
jgi:hypothetical protein